MVNPPHLCELIRESLEDVGWSVAETATQLGCEQGTSYRTRHLNGKAGGSVNMTLALERIGWGTTSLDANTGEILSCSGSLGLIVQTGTLQL